MINAPEDDFHTSVKDDSVSEPDDAAVKPEVAVSSKAGTRKALSVAPVAAGERTTSVEDGSRAVPEAAVKTEVKIALPSKNAAAGGEL